MKQILLTLTFLLGAFSLNAQNVTGTVVDNTGEPIIGASVMEVGQSNGTVTDLDGNFTLKITAKAQLRISYIGYDTQTVEVNPGQKLKITMISNAQNIDEVVVVGFGTQKKVNLTGAVTSVSAKDLTSRPVNSVVDALQGVVPGMNFSTGSGGGALDSQKSFNIRGTGTIGAGSSVTPLVLVDGMEGDLNILNPQDIENISVLKDAAASSIYGSRAAGGVILVTTKKGKAGKTVVNYNNSLRFNSPLNMPEMANSYDFAVYFNKAGNSTMFSDEKLAQIKACMADPTLPNLSVRSDGRWEVWDNLANLPTANTDWLKTHFGNSFSQEHTLSATGGSENIQYYVSANYLNQEGILKQANDRKKRYDATAKINANLASWAKLSYNMRFSRTDYVQPTYMDGLFYHNVCRYWPIIPVTDLNGNYMEDSKIYQLRNGGEYKTQSDVLTQQLALVLEPIKNWFIHAELNYKTENDFEHTDWQTVYAYDSKENPYVIENNTSSVREYAYKSNYFNPNIYTEYSRSFGDHNFKIMAGYQSEWFKYRNVQGQRDGILSGLPTLNTTSTNPKVAGGYYDWTTVGFFGRLNYDYKGRYLVEANLRYDGSSRFLKENRWNWFPSFSFGWNISQEDFFKDATDVVNSLKLRASWGRLGNQNTDSWYPFYPTIGYSTNAGNWLVNGTKPNISSEPALVSSSLTWEKNRTWNVGVDVGVLNNRLNLSFDYFQRKTFDMVGPAPELPDILGTSVPKVNNLDMTSKGWELAVRWRDQIGDFSYGATLSLSDNFVVIDKYPNPSKNLENYYAGARLGDIWGYTTVGLANSQEEMDAHLANANQNTIGSNWQAGDVMYADLNGDKVVNTGTYTADDHGDLKIIGNSTPRYSFGLNLDASYKGFDLKVFFQGILKRDYWANGVMFWGANGGKWQSVCFKEHLDYWTAENTGAYYPRPDWNTSKNQQTQTGYLQNAAYCRLKNVTLGYTLPAAISQKFYVQNLRLFVSGENLLTITDFTKMADPELVGVGSWGFGKTYPLSKTFSVGLSVTF